MFNDLITNEWITDYFGSHEYSYNVCNDNYIYLLKLKKTTATTGLQKR